MNTLTIIVLTAIVEGLLYRTMKLSLLVSKAREGCVALIAFPFTSFFCILPIFLFIKVDWWIPVVAFFIGLTVVNLIGIVLERILQIPYYQTTKDYSFVDACCELSVQDRLYRRAVALLLFFCVVSITISLFIFFNV